MKPEAVEWVRSKGLVDPMSFALSASEERLVDSELIPLMSADGVKIVSIMEKVSVRKAWTLCRSRMKDEEIRQTTGEGAEEKSLPTLTGQGLDSKWKELHGFVLSGERKLAETVQNRIFVQLSAEPPRLEQFAPEMLRLLGSVDSKKHQDLIVEAGKIKAAQSPSDTIAAHHILLIRLRAFWFTAAWCCIHNPGMFCLQDCLFMEDKMMALIFQTFNGQLAPESYYISAWNQTLRRFGESMRTDGHKLVTRCRTTANWEDLRTGWKHSDSEAEGPSRMVDWYLVKLSLAPGGNEDSGRSRKRPRGGK